MRSAILSVISNKYVIAFVIVIIWLFFFERHSILQQRRVSRELREYKKDREFYIKEIYRDSAAIREIREDPEALERLAREKYFMKKKDEDIFIIKQ